MMRKTWLLGFGFFSISVTWSLYNAFVPLFLDDFIGSAALIGFLMTVDNYFALFLQPLVGYASDRIDTRIGKRMPFLLIGMPLGALFFSLIPFYTGPVMLVLFMVLMNLSMGLYRSPTVALMPDITVDVRRSQANGIINFMGGLGSVLAFGVGSMLYNLHRTVPFLTAAAVTLASLVILLVFIREKRDTVSYSVRVKQPMPVLKELDRTTVLMLGAIFFWFVAYQGVEAMFTLYGTNHLGMSDSEASFSLLYFSAAFLLTCIPAGFLGTRFGKKVTMTIGVAGLGSVFVAMIFINATIWLQFVLIVGGIFWAFININSYPYIVSVGKDERIGTRTGLYYLVSALSAIISPPLLGRLIDLFGYSVMFLYSAAAMALAFVCICCVKRDKTTVDPGLSADKA